MKLKLHFLLLIILLMISSCKPDSDSSVSSTLLNDVPCENDLKQPQIINLKMPVNEANATKIDFDQIPKIVSSSFVGDRYAWFITYFDRKIFNSVDCGSKWKEIQIDSDEKPQVIYFIDSNNGWLLTSGVLLGSVLRTQDGGKSWLKIGQIEYGLANKMFFANDKKGLIFGYFSLWQTEDGGKTWAERHFEQKYDGRPNNTDFINYYNANQ